MSTPIRVLVVSHYFAGHRGGVEMVAEQLAVGLARRGLSVTWVAGDTPPCAGSPDFTTLPMRAWNITEKRFGFPYPIWSPGSLARLVRAVRQCDVVHLHDCLYMGNVVAYLTARIARKPVVVTQHIGIVPYSNHCLRAALELANRLLGSLVLGGCAQAVFVSRNVQHYFSQRIDMQATPLFVANGVDHGRFSPLDKESRRRLRESLHWDAQRPVMLFVGRFVEKKGLHLLRQLAMRFTACLWVFVGWGSERPERWGLDNVMCLGAADQDRLADYYRAADWLVLPSIGEGFPLVVQEAMACGTPAIISRETARGCPGIEPILPVCELDLNSLTERIQRLLDATEDCDSHRQQVASFARKEWDWERCAQFYADLFVRLALPRSTAQEDGRLARLPQAPSTDHSRTSLTPAPPAAP